MPRAFYRARCWSVDVYKRMWWLLNNAGGRTSRSEPVSETLVTGEAKPLLCQR